jgi:trans-2,3-dihydro-3-hydroxyanthranilate isomerase
MKELWMRQLHYHLVDVFTDRPFGGNQLAVFTDGRGIAAETMQQIARELNLSEVTFVLPPDDSANHYRVRIFTPGMELPMAGHPTIGTAYVLAREKLIDTSGNRSTIRLEEKVGVIPIVLELSDGAPGMITMQQPLPTYGAVYPNWHAIAEMLSIDLEDFDAPHPMQAVSCGVPFLLVPLKTRLAVEKIKMRVDVWERVLRDFEAPHVFVFTRETATPEGTVHSRMFAPAMGIPEDPATGAASGPLGCYLIKYKMINDNPAKIISEQGFEMGRPSLVHIEIEQMGGDITRVNVGGQCVYIGAGFLEL